MLKEPLNTELLTVLLGLLRSRKRNTLVRRSINGIWDLAKMLLYGVSVRLHHFPIVHSCIKILMLFHQLMWRYEIEFVISSALRLECNQ